MFMQIHIFQLDKQILREKFVYRLPNIITSTQSLTIL